MIKKKIILTFDYEMYLGKDSGTIEKCMLEPTNKILEILKKNNFKGLFFVDATFLTILKKDYQEGYIKVKKQILELLKYGNDVGLHIHSHWVDSYMINKNRWSFKSYKNFRIHNLSEDTKSKLIRDSYNELNSICQEFSSDYKIDAFRAGGWCIQPFKYIKNDLEDLGIKCDFSVLPQMKKDNLPKHYYDFTNTFSDKDYWKFDDDVLKESSNGCFIEIPTTVIKMNIFDIIKLKKAIKGYVLSGDGKGADEIKSGFISKLKKLRPFIRYTLSSDYMILDMFKKNINKFDKDFLVYVSHPKNFSDESFKILEFLVNNYSSLNYRELK